jgi:hypothetical protein
VLQKNLKVPSGQNADVQKTDNWTNYKWTCLHLLVAK